MAGARLVQDTVWKAELRDTAILATGRAGLRHAAVALCAVGGVGLHAGPRPQQRHVRRVALAGCCKELRHQQQPIKLPQLLRLTTHS